MPSDHRPYKDALYEQFARIGHALASPKRLEILDLLAQGEKTVETVSEQIATPLKNTSAHLRVLRGACLVERRRDGQHVRYQLAGDDVGSIVRAVQSLAKGRLAEVDAVVRTYVDRPEGLEPVRPEELRRRLREGNVMVVDVRPSDEYEAGHISGSVSIPIAELRRRLRTLRRRGEVVAYCRGPYCVFADEAVHLLRENGVDARRLDGGLPEWRERGYPVAEGGEART